MIDEILPPPPSEYDAIRVCSEALEALQQPERNRVLQYLVSRFRVSSRPQGAAYRAPRAGSVD